MNTISTAHVNMATPVLIKEQKIIPWSYYVLGGCTVVGAIIALAGYILSQPPMLGLGIGLGVISGLGAYEIKRLSLTKRMEESVNEYKGLNERLIAEIKQLKEEKLAMDGSNLLLQTKIDQIAEQNKTIDELTIKLQNSDEKTETQINNLHIEIKELKDLEESLNSQVKILENQKKELAELQSKERDSIELLKEGNLKLDKSIQELQANCGEFKAEILKFSDENSSLKGLLEDKKAIITTIKQEREEFQKQNKILNETVTKFRHENESFKSNLQKNEDFSLSIEKTIQELEAKVLKKSEKMKQLKRDYEEKLKTLNEEIVNLKNQFSDVQLKHADSTIHLKPKTEKNKGL